MKKDKISDKIAHARVFAVLTAAKNAHARVFGLVLLDKIYDALVFS